MNILWLSFMTSKVLVQATNVLNGNAFYVNPEMLNFGVGWVSDTWLRYFMVLITPSR
jgi:hypothetical protein